MLAVNRLLAQPGSENIPAHQDALTINHDAGAG